MRSMKSFVQIKSIIKEINIYKLSYIIYSTKKKIKFFFIYKSLSLIGGTDGLPYKN